ncbi:MAG: type I restriction enzyme HsdR N-terminal domain-containing protein [Marinifilaceae bacterium]
MEKLNLPNYSFKIKSELQRNLIFDSIRKKYVKLTPEEWVRQNFIQYLIQEKHFPPGLMAVEMGVNINKLPQRSDIVLFNSMGNPLVIVECKATHIKISQETFNQIARYNMKLRVEYLIVTNGLRHYCCKMDYEKQTYSFLPQVPDYLDIRKP